MKKKSFQLRIDEPCHESWDKMTNSEKGRFCQSCQKEVIDFTDLSDRAIAQTFKKAKGNICGRFDNLQLNRPIAHEPTVYQNTRLKAMGLMFSGLLMSSQLVGQNSQTSEVKTEQLENFPKEESEQTEIALTLITIKGQVLRLEKEPIQIAIIDDNRIIEHFQLIDKTDNFEFNINTKSVRDISKGLIVRFENDTYEKEILLSEKQLFYRINIDLGIVILDEKNKGKNIEIITRQVILGAVASIDVEDLESPIIPKTIIEQNSKTTLINETPQCETEKSQRVYGNTTVMDYLDDEDENIITTKIIKKTYPNPFSNELIVDLESEKAGNYHLILVNELGQEVYRKSIETIEGKQQIKLELQHFLAGVYFLSLLDREDVLQTEMVIKE